MSIESLPLNSQRHARVILSFEWIRLSPAIEWTHTNPRENFGSIKCEKFAYEAQNYAKVAQRDRAGSSVRNKTKLLQLHGDEKGKKGNVNGWMARKMNDCMFAVGTKWNLSIFYFALTLACTLEGVSFTAFCVFCHPKIDENTRRQCIEYRMQRTRHCIGKVWMETQDTTG